MPLSNLVSHCKLFDLDPSKQKPRDWISPIRAAAEVSFVIIPELKRVEPMTGSLRKRYDIQTLSKQFVQSGAAAMSINSDKVLFGGSLEDITESREATTKAILESIKCGRGSSWSSHTGVRSDFISLSTLQTTSRRCRRRQPHCSSFDKQGSLVPQKNCR